MYYTYQIFNFNFCLFQEKGNSMTFSSAGGQQQTFSTIQESSSQSAASFKSASTFESKFLKAKICTIYISIFLLENIKVFSKTDISIRYI